MGGGDQQKLSSRVERQRTDWVGLQDCLHRSFHSSLREVEQFDGFVFRAGHQNLLARVEIDAGDVLEKRDQI